MGQEAEFVITFVGFPKNLLDNLNFCGVGGAYTLPLVLDNMFYKQRQGKLPFVVSGVVVCYPSPINHSTMIALILSTDSCYCGCSINTLSTNTKEFLYKGKIWT